MHHRFALLFSAVLATASGFAGHAAAEPPLADSRCASAGLVDPAFRDAALAALERLVVHAPGQPADGAVRSHQTAGLLDAEGHAWYQVSAYQVNLGVIGALSVGPRALPLAADWLRWQARHIALRGAARGVVLDTWVRADTLEESTCPSGLAPRLCSDVDAYDSTAATTLLVADAYLRRGGDALLLREPAMREALEAAASALAALLTPDGLTLAKPTHPIVYTMDQVEVAAGWRAWARLQRNVYAQPASADNTLATAIKAEAAVRSRLALEGAWSVSLNSGQPLRSRWYPDTVAQAWPLLWLPEANDRARPVWIKAISPWQGAARLNWTLVNVDPDGFWWPAAAAAAACTGDEANARAWVARARQRWLDPAAPFAWPFQVGDLLWLLWLAEPQQPPSRVRSDSSAAKPLALLSTVTHQELLT